ncbi:MAG TPA: RNA polymerase sigma factor [Tepidiformaceae bacterium]|nr:RNA polymerase sigma factor [Tepidiformaceae bacterium]HMO96969.1 RNA polymerase sigma factor [Tepidiformaceae bacterium]
MQESLSFPQAKHAGPHRAAELDTLALRAAQGDRAAFEAIYNAMVDELHAYVRGQCRNDTVAEDIVANVFLKAWRSAKSYRPGSRTFQSWMFTIARNEVRDYWRSSQRTLPMLDLDITDDGEPSQQVDPKQAGEILRRAMQGLTDDQRQVVVLRYFGNKTHEEIATIMGKREGAVRALLTRALRQMRKVMGDAAPQA